MRRSDIADTPRPPYYAVIFTARRTPGDDAGYAATATRIAALAAAQPGYLGMESAQDGVEITVSYWRDLASIHAWKRQLDHAEAQARGRAAWYDDYSVRVARVERAYGFTA